MKLPLVFNNGHQACAGKRSYCSIVAFVLDDGKRSWIDFGSENPEEITEGTQLYPKGTVADETP